MNEYIKFISDNYHEVITLPDNEMPPKGYKKLLFLDDGTNKDINSDDIVPHKSVQFIIHDDVVYFRFIDNCIEKSIGNIRNVPIQNFIYMDLKDDLQTPTEQIQTEIKEILSKTCDPLFIKSLDKAHSIFIQHLSSLDTLSLSTTEKG